MEGEAREGCDLRDCPSYMRIAAITKFKEGVIFGLLRQLQWSQSELARRSGVSPTTISKIICLRSKPAAKVAQKIQNAFGAVGVFVDVTSIWPENFVGFEASVSLEQYAEIDPGALLDFREQEIGRLSAAEFEVWDPECLEMIVAGLPPADKWTYEQLRRFHLEDEKPDFGGVSRARIFQKIHQLQRRLRRRRRRYYESIKTLGPVLTRQVVSVI